MSEGAPVLVYKTCAIAPQVVERRLEVLQDRIYTYHDYENLPTKKKVWELSRSCKLSPVNSADIKGQDKHIRPRHVTGLGELVKSEQEVKKAKLYCFDLVWPPSWTISGYSTLGVCCKTREEAQRLHQMLEDRIGASSNISSPNASVSDMTPPKAPLLNSVSDLVFDPLPQSSATGPAQSPRNLPQPQHHLIAEEPQLKPSREPQHDSTATAGSATQLQPSTNQAESLSEPLDIKRRPAPNVSHGNWMPYRQSNGVAVYHNPGNTGNAEFMVSHVVRGSPLECVKAIMHPGGYTTVLGPASWMYVWPDTDNRMVVELHLEATGSLGQLMPRRTVVLEQRHHPQGEEGGYHAVYFTTLKERPAPVPDAESAPVGNNWAARMWGVVPATVNGCYTISGLKYKGDDSEESLITCVLECDLGGLCSPSSWAYPFMQLLGVPDAFVERMLMAAMLVRDEVEHRRFTEPRPLQMLAADDDDEEYSDCLTQLESGAFLEDDPLGPLPSPAPRDSSVRNVHDRSQPSLTPRALIKMQSRLQPDKSTASKDGSAATTPQGVTMSEGSGLLQRTASVVGAVFRPSGTLAKELWTEIHRPGAERPFKVRGANYLVDKVKVPAGEPMFALGAVDLVLTDEPIQHIARFLPSIRDSTAPFSFIVQLIIPGSPITGLVMTFINEHHPNDLGPDPVAAGSSPFDCLLHKFMNTTDDERNEMLKLIPNIAEGSWIVRHSVGSTPCKLGKKLVTTYHVTDRYIEVDVDISANAAGSYVVGLVKGAMKTLVVDLAIVLEGRETHELPEVLLGNVRLIHVDMSTHSVRLDIPPNSPQADSRVPTMARTWSRKKNI